MSIAALEAKALRHWKEWLPKKVAALRAEGRLEKAVHGAALLAQALRARSGHGRGTGR